MSNDPKPPHHVTTDDGQDITMLRSEAVRKDVDYSNTVGEFIRIMREIQRQGPLDDPNVIFIDKDGTRYY